MTRGEFRKRCAFHEAGHVIAATTYGIPVIAASIADHHSFMHRGDYRERVELAVEAMAVLCLSGRASEEAYVGPVTDDSDAIDIEDARAILAPYYDALQIGFQLNRLRDSARALVTTPLASAHIPVLADALLGYGTLTGAQITALLTKNEDRINWVMENYGHTVEEAIADLKEFGGLVAEGNHHAA